MPLEEQAMEKKNTSRTAGALVKCNQDTKAKPNTECNQNGRAVRGRKPQSFQPPPKKPSVQKSKQVGDKRPRERNLAAAGAQYSRRGQVEPEGDVGSVFSKGSKKGYQDASYLLNFTFDSARDAHVERYSGSQWRQSRTYHQPHQQHASRIHRPRYVKEQYLQAKCQFVVRDDGNYAPHYADPDRLLDWSSVEQVWLQDEELTDCPICLYPPTATRITRCGHIFCWTCMLHYLALSDQTHRKCPICEEQVYADQLRSCRLISRSAARHGDTLTFRLMRRDRYSLQAQPVGHPEPSWEPYISLADPEEKQRLARLILASAEQVQSSILSVERTLLEQQLAELADQPEACFVQQALSLLTDRELSVSEWAAAASAKPQRPDPELTLAEATPLPSAQHEDTIVYQSAFDDEQLDTPAVEEGGAVGGGDTSVRVRSVSETSNIDVTVADLEVPPQSGQEDAAAAQQDKPLYFYQAENGHHVYLHALNCRMLLEESGGCWEQCPHTLTARVVDIDSVTMTEAFRQRLRSLCHLPLTTQLQVVEVSLQPPLVSPQTLALFKDQIKKREQRRKDKERRERQRERRLRQQQQGRRQPTTAYYATDFPAERGLSPPPELVTYHQPPCSHPSSPPEQQQQLQGVPNSQSVPSFAQLLRSAGGASAPAAGSGGAVWPSAPRPRPLSPAAAPPAPADLESEGAAPAFSHSWSADLAAALEQIDRGRADTSDHGAESKSKGKKGKKGKTVLISGGFNF